MTEQPVRAQHPATQMAGTVHDLDAHRATKVSLTKSGTNTGQRATNAVPLTPVPQATLREPLWKRTGHVVGKAATDERTRRAGRAAFRHAAYVAGGVRITTRRLWDSRTAARYERMIRAAEAAGNAELAKEWEERCRSYRAARHQRRMDLLQLPGKLARAVLVGSGTAVGGLLVLGGIMAVATGSWADILTPLMAVVTLIYWLTVIVALVWAPVMVAAPWLALAGLWSVGRKSQAAPQWAMPPAQRTEDSGAPITPSVVVTAMRDLGISAMRKAIKEMGDNGAAMLGPITIAGCGVEVDVLLPSGVSTAEVQSKRRKLAENLARHEHEVFITIPTAARTVRLWIADSGALDEPIGPSPLVLDAEMTASYKTGKAPWGQDLRGDAAQLSLYQRHLLITGMSNQGKTASLRALTLWLGLDPTVEFRIADLKGAGDWAMFDGIATTLIQGPTDEHVIEATEMLEAGVAEMERRLQQPPGTVFTPLILLVDEEQVAFMCPAVDDKKRPYGGSKANSRYFMAARKINNQGRAVDVLLYQGTQDPTDQNLPKLVREGAHTRASLALGTESQARMALGDKAVDGGAAPNLLRPGLDKGTVVLASDGIKIPSGQASITVRTHYISTDDAKQLAERITDLRGQITTRHETDGEGPEERDHLADLIAVVGDESRVLTQDVLHRLRALSETAYGHWTPGDLKAALEGTGAEPYKSDGRMVISRERLHHALTNRGDDDSASGPE